MTEKCKKCNDTGLYRAGASYRHCDCGAKPKKVPDGCYAFTVEANSPAAEELRKRAWVSSPPGPAMDYRVTILLGNESGFDRLGLFERWDPKASRWRIMARCDGLEILTSSAAGGQGQSLLDALVRLPSCWSGRLELQLPHLGAAGRDGG